MSDNHMDNTEEGMLFSKYGKHNPFVVPDGYFEAFLNKVAAKMEVEEELKEFSILSEIKKEKVFSLPADYFKSGEDSLEFKHELAAFKELSKINKPVIESPLADADYFASVNGKILKKIEAADELKEYSLLYAIDKQNNFAIVPDYFDTLADRVKERGYAEAAQPSIISKVLGYILKPRIAFAYSIVLIVGVSLIVYNKTNSSSVNPESGDCKTLACLEKREMLNDHTIRELDDDNLYDMVDVEALGKQISGDSAKTNPVSVKIKDADSITKNK